MKVKMKFYKWRKCSVNRSIYLQAQNMNFFPKAALHRFFWMNPKSSFSKKKSIISDGTMSISPLFLLFLQTESELHS